MILHNENRLPRTAPEQQGIASAGLLRFIEALDSQIHELHSVMLLRYGAVVAEAWWSPYAAERPHLLFSLSKSFTATAVGLAIDEGYFTLDDPVTSFFPAETPLVVSEFLAAMQVKHLLTMATGHASDPWTAMNERLDGNWIKAFLAYPIATAPGSQFVYNTGATYLLSAIIQATTGMRLSAYLDPRLFAPLGIEQMHWQESPQGITLGGIGLSLTTEAVAKFGQLYLHKGLWNKQRILSEAWVDQATALQITNGDDPDSDWAQGYGYQFWRCRHGSYRGDGVFGQYCIVLPAQDAVLAITAGIDVLAMQQPLDLVWQLLLPIMGTSSLAADPVAQRALTEKLASLGFSTVAGQASSPLAELVSGRSYQVAANRLGLERIQLHFSAAGCRLLVHTATSVETLVCGYGVWQAGATALFQQAFFGHTPFVASGAWTNEASFIMQVRLYETPFVYGLTLDFIDTELLIEIRINTALDSLAPVVLTAQQLSG
ncbi:serine hydrolase domain-containing protein [Herpetosiphon giganteus]|uniref:serine hydrolase domain-containing protein n=1 Tax=Herpetosiphon giganteus TaxID=2029754 RepID=UPI0019587953|nr:serine hydrolase [Herpetosiphon giganteus]MBM7844685.1 CubicO group peptidase (beta-lactamase class C family) [Herpetosiphon giganteus]